MSYTQTTSRKHASRLARIVAVVSVLAATLAFVPAHASGAITMLYPNVDQELEALQVRPTVAFDPADKEKPKWVLLATDVEMTQTVRYCRQFFAAAISGLPSWHWACNAWATGVDQMGQDKLQNLAWGKTYYWQVIYTDAAGVEQKSDVRKFSLKEWEEGPDPGTVSDQIYGSAVGSQLNTGASAFALSGLKIPAIASKRVKPNRFRIAMTYIGGVDLKKSYVLLKGRGQLAGSKKLKLTTWGPNRLKAVWIRSSFETRLPVAQYSYQAFLVSTKNGAAVKSKLKIVVIKGKKKRAVIRRY